MSSWAGGVFMEKMAAIVDAFYTLADQNMDGKITDSEDPEASGN